MMRMLDTKTGTYIYVWMQILLRLTYFPADDPDDELT